MHVKNHFMEAIVVIVILISVFSLAFTTKSTMKVEAAKPSSVMAWSNGFPSGAHFNLNIHGKRDSFVCDPTPGGGSIFVREYGDSEIQYIMNKKSSLTELYVIDPCAMSKNDPAKVQLPKGTYQVYARILGKPGKAKTDEIRKVVFYPKLIDTCNDNATEPISGFGDFIDCTDESLIGLGVVTTNGAFNKEEQELIRIAPVRGKNQAQPITDMFYWSGYVCDDAFDTNGDGEITLADITADLTGDGIINQDDLNFYLNFNCQQFTNTWIFDIADLVIYGWDYQNSGSKLVQIRFYPEGTTTYS